MCFSFFYQNDNNFELDLTFQIQLNNLTFFKLIF